MNTVTFARVEKALEKLSIEGIDFNAEFEIEGFWCVQENADEAEHWDCHLERIELGHNTPFYDGPSPLAQPRDS